MCIVLEICFLSKELKMNVVDHVQDLEHKMLIIEPRIHVLDVAIDLSLKTLNVF